MINYTEDLSLHEIIVIYRITCMEEREALPEDVPFIQGKRKQLQHLVNDFITTMQSIYDVVICDWGTNSTTERGVNKGGIRGGKKGGEYQYL